MKKRYSVLLLMLLLLMLFSVIGLSAHAVETAPHKEIAATGLSKEIAPTGTHYEDLGASFYARIWIEEPLLSVTMPAEEKRTTQMRPNADSSEQFWHFTRQSDGSYKIRSVSSNLYLELYNGAYPAENKETWHTFENKLPDQRWFIKKVDNCYQFIACCNTNFLLKAVNLYGHNPELLISSDFSKESTHFFITKLPYTSDYLSTPSFKLANVYGGVKITWNKVDHATSYRVYRYNASKKQWVALTKTSGTSYTDKSVSSGTTYQYMVKSATPLLSKGTSKSIKYIAAPSPAVDNTAAGPVISWKKVAGAAAYKVLYKTTGAWQSAGTTTALKLTHKTASFNVNYTYTVQCVSSDRKTNTSAYNPTGIKNMIVKTPKVTVKLTPTGYQLNWPSIKGAYRYKVMIKSKATNWTWNKQIRCIYNNYFYGQPVSNQAYYFTVRCLDKSGKYISGYTSSAKYTYYAAPKVKEFKRSGSTIRLAWNKIPGAYKYDVCSWNGKKWINRGTTASTAINVKVSGTAAQNKCFAVKCLNKNGKVISSYFETVYNNGRINSYSPGGYSSKNKF